MPHPLRYLFGYVTVSVSRSDAPRVVNMLNGMGRVYRDFRFSEDRAVFDLPFFLYKRTVSAFVSAGVGIRIEARRGIPYLLYRYRHRYGLFAGAFLFLFIVVFSGQLLWDVRVSGNTSLDAEQVRRELAAEGLCVGNLIRSIDTPMLENRVLIKSDDIAWMSINIIGTVAEVEIREAIPEPENTEFYECADVIATRDGVVEWLEDTKGNALVMAGDTVKAGDVLISGYYPETDTSGAIFRVAEGRVYARTEREFSVSIPYGYTKKQYTGREKCEKYLIFFKKEVKFFGNSRNLYENCDTIDTVDYFELPGGVLLPFGVRTVRYAEYESVSAERSVEAATELALYSLRCMMADGVTDGMLVKKRFSTSSSDGKFHMVCYAEYIENIGEVKETHKEQYSKKED